MNASFEEKSIWIQLTSILLSLGIYFFIAAQMLFSGVDVLPVYVPLFVIAVIWIVVINAVGHIVIGIIDRSTSRDERDRLIGWRAESNSSWILGFGTIVAIVCLITSVKVVWVAHLLLLSLFLAEIVKYAFQIVYYRQGI